MYAIGNGHAQISVRLQRHTNSAGFFNVPVQAMTWSQLLFGYPRNGPLCRKINDNILAKNDL